MADGALALTAALVELFSAGLPRWQEHRGRDRQRFVNAVASRLAEHHLQVARWSEESHLPTALMSLPTRAPTIGLQLRSIPRRFGGYEGEHRDESDLLLDSGDFAVLGDPGAGKTTTLRRLAGLVALEAPRDVLDSFRYVVLVVCRERDLKQGLYPVLGDITGVVGAVAELVDDPELEIRRILGQGALILVDGLDEVRAADRARIEVELVQLARGLTSSKLIVSCRSGRIPRALGRS